MALSCSISMPFFVSTARDSFAYDSTFAEKSGGAAVAGNEVDELSRRNWNPTS